MSHISQPTRRAAASLLVALSLGSLHISSTTLAAQSAPPLAAPVGTILNVSTEAELQTAVVALEANTTIVLAPGTYTLTSTLHVRGPLTNVGIRGATANPDDVVLVGRGMTQSDYGAVPHGISVSGRVQGIIIANLTIRDVYNHPIVLEAGTQAPHLYNLHMLNAGRQFIKAGSEAEGVNDGSIEHSTIEYTTTSATASVSGIEVIAGRRWTLRKNLFRNIKAPSGLLAGPAVLMSQGSRDTVADGNTFINCQREIAFGMEQRMGSDHSGGIIRNNFVYRESSVSGDAAIQIADSPNTLVVHNTILANGTAASLIEYRFPTTAGVDIRNNLLDGPIVGRDGATGRVESNYTRATADMFANAAAGDLHLVSSAAAVIDVVHPLPSAGTDWDGQSRPQGRAADYGADERIIGDTRTIAMALPQSSTESSGTSALQATDASALAGTSGLPAPWKQTGVGNPALPGFAAYGSGLFAVQGGGVDIGGGSDQFWFVYQTLDGDGEIVARVDSLYKTHVGAKAGVMIRDELTANARHAFVMVTAEQGLAFQRRVTQGGSATQTAGSNERAPHWVKLKRTGSTFSAFSSNDGVNWKLMGSATVSINRLAYVGLAIASRTVRTNTNAVFTGVTVGPASERQNQPPTVSITAPTPGASYKAPASVTVAAQAADADGSVMKVDFYAGSSLVGSDSTSPFSVTWSNAPAGTHRLQAVAHDDAGAWSPSSTVEISIAGNQPPTVTLTSPAPNTSFTAPASITMTAAATDSGGTISKVEFYAGSTLIGSDTSSPYSVTWSEAPAGTYTLSAKAWDNGGASMISGGVNVNIGAPAGGGLPRLVIFNASADHANVMFYTAEVFKAGSNPTTTTPFRTQHAGKPTPVNGEITVDIASLVQALPAGSYFIIIAATGSGGTSRSGPSESFVR